MGTPSATAPVLRASDRFQRWLSRFLLLCVTVGVPFATVAAGVWTYRAQLHVVRTEAASRHAVTARLTSDAPTGVSPGGASVPGSVTWTAADGSRHTARVAVAPGSRAGAPVRLWVDSGGSVVGAPATRGQAVTTALTAAVLACCTGTAFCLVAWKGSVLLLDRHRYACWDAEWERIEPRWSQRPSG